MTNYPDRIDITKLNSFHEDYKYYSGIWDMIADFEEGAPALLRYPQKYLKQRPGEENDVYLARLEKLSFTPVMTEAIKNFTTFLQDAPYELEGTDSDEDFWQRIRANWDGKDTSERLWQSEVFSTLLHYGRVFVAVDLPDTGAVIRSRAEKLALGNDPYAITYTPDLIIDYEPYQWYKARQIISRGSALTGRRHYLRYTIWEPEATVVYEAEVRLNQYPSVLLGTVAYQEEVMGQTSYSCISEVFDGLEWVSLGYPDLKIPMKGQPFYHGHKKPLMTHLILKKEMWTGKAVVLKQKQHFIIESAWTESGALSGIVQRVFTPAPPPPANDYRVSYEQPSADNLKTDNAHVLIGQKFEFVESTGAAITNQEAMLDKIEQQIRAIACLSFASSSPNKGTVEQSGESKKVDRDLIENTMKTHGYSVKKLSQQLLDMMATLRGTEPPTATGLDRFDVSSLEAMITQTLGLGDLVVPLPPSAMKVWYNKLIGVMLGHISAELQEAIDEELEALFAPEETEETEEPEDSDMPARIAEAFGLTEDELNEVLGDA